MELKIRPLTREAFAPFGDVIEIAGAQHFPINEGTVERFHDLAAVDLGPESGARPVISIARCDVVAGLPHPVRVIERHPLGSQAFFPLSDTPMVVVVAPAGDTVDIESLRAFISDGRQGINYHRGTWHMPLIALESHQQFMVVDRGGPGNNCEERRLDHHEVVVDR